MSVEAPQDVERILQGLHEWRGVQGVVQTTLQALYDVVHSQSKAVREVELRLDEVHDDLEAAIGQRARSEDLRGIEEVAGRARAAAEQATRRVEEEADCAREAREVAAEEMRALRAGVSEQRTAVDRLRADVQQWRSSLEASFSRLTAECSYATQSLQDECRVVQAELQASVQQESARVREALGAKASLADLRAEVSETRLREEGQLARLQQAVEGKASSADLATVASLIEGKASLTDVESLVQRQVQRKVASMISEKHLLGHEEVVRLVDAATNTSLEALRECEQRTAESARRQQRTSAAQGELRAELRALASVKMEKAEVEAMVAGALADWARAAQRGADAVHAAMSRKRGWTMDLETLPPKETRWRSTIDESVVRHQWELLGWCCLAR